LIKIKSAALCKKTVKTPSLTTISEFDRIVLDQSKEAAGVSEYRDFQIENGFTWKEE